MTIAVRYASNCRTSASCRRSTRRCAPCAALRPTRNAQGSRCDTNLVSSGQDLLNGPSTAFRERTMPAAKKYEATPAENEGGITWLLINRPDKPNARSPQVHLEMDETLDELAVDPATEVLVLTGAGNAFSAGQDIKLYFRANAGDAAARHKLRRASNNWRWQKLSTFPKPSIAM